MNACDSHSERMRHRTNEMLERHLSVALLHRGNPDAPEHMLTPHQAELEAYVAAGALTPQQAADWFERFRRAGRALMLAHAADDATRARANELLQAQVSALAPTSEERDPAASQRFYASLWALHSVGAITGQQYARFEERAATKPKPGYLRPPSGPPYAATDLQRVVAGPPEPEGAVRLICAELYADCVMLRWHRVLTPDEARARDGFDQFANFPHGLLEKHRRWGADFQLQDDCATRYENAGPLVGWIGLYPDDSDRQHGGHAAVRGFVTFVPAVPPDAMRLVAVNGSDRFTIALAES